MKPVVLVLLLTASFLSLPTALLFAAEPNLIPLLDDATHKSREIIDSQPQPESFSPQELQWLDAEAHRRWDVSWSDLFQEGHRGDQRRELLLRWLNTVVADHPGPAPAPADRRPRPENWTAETPWGLPHESASRWHP